MKGILIEPLDTLFFRDGTPFSAGSTSQADVGGLFPPHPLTMAGAIRAAIARCNGWSGRGRWSRKLNTVLGDGPDELGKISLGGPFIVRDGQPLFPMPRHLLGMMEAGRWTPRIALLPGPEVVCDLGDTVRLPKVPRTGLAVEELKVGEGGWLTHSGLQAVLGGMLPAATEIVSASELWSEERRVGLQRDRSTRTAQEGMLYSTRHVRLKRGVALGVRVSGVPDGWKFPYGEMIPLGGESRTAECQCWDVDLSLGTPLSAIEDRSRVVVIALTPLDLDPGVCRGEIPLAALGDARVVSACLGRPQRIGGWDSLARRPLPQRSVLPPGSVLFCELDDPRCLLETQVASDGLVRVGMRQRFGFGAVALGSWSDETEVIP